MSQPLDYRNRDAPMTNPPRFGPQRDGRVQHVGKRELRWIGMAFFVLLLIWWVIEQVINYVG